MKAVVDRTGTVSTGRGLGAQRMAGAGVLARMRDLAGFALVPGTLNLRFGSRSNAVSSQPTSRPARSIRHGSP